MKHAIANQGPEPWYTQFWAWFVLMPLILVVIACAITVSIAFRQADDVVIDNYYKEGRMINQRLEQDQYAAKAGLSGKLRFDLDVGEIVLFLDTQTTKEGKSIEEMFPPKLLLLLNHPTSAARDRQIILNETAPGQYRGDLERGLNYRWYIYIIPSLLVSDRNLATWRLTGEIDFNNTHTMTLTAEQRE